MDELVGKLKDKLVNVGLVEADRQVYLGQFLTDWLTKKRDMGFKPASLLAWGQTVEELTTLFGGKFLRALTNDDGEKYRSAMRDRELSLTTIHKRLAHARQMLEDAVRSGHLQTNPWKYVRQRQGNPADNREYVSVDKIEKVLKQCPNVWWRLLVALARFGGLRTPSESFSLTWGDVDWERNRLSIPSPKTEHSGKTYRIIPLFPLLRPHVVSALECAEKGSDFIIPDEYRRRARGPGGWGGANFRTTLKKIVRKAGVEPWHSLRASCQSNLAHSFSLAVVTKWLGNTPSVALRHSVDPTESAFDKAMTWTHQGGAKSGARPAQKRAQQAAATSGMEGQNVSASLENKAIPHDGATACDLLHERGRECIGIEPTGGVVHTPHRF